MNKTIPQLQPTAVSHLYHAKDLTPPPTVPVHSSPLGGLRRPPKSRGQGGLVQNSKKQNARATAGPPPVAWCLGSVVLAGDARRYAAHVEFVFGVPMLIIEGLDIVLPD
jgi:hypothetical protein